MIPRTILWNIENWSHDGTLETFLLHMSGDAQKLPGLMVSRVNEAEASALGEEEGDPRKIKARVSFDKLHSDDGILANGNAQHSRSDRKVAHDYSFQGER